MVDVVQMQVDGGMFILCLFMALAIAGLVHIEHRLFIARAREKLRIDRIDRID